MYLTKIFKITISPLFAWCSSYTFVKKLQGMSCAWPILVLKRFSEIHCVPRVPMCEVLSQLYLFTCWFNKKRKRWRSDSVLWQNSLYQQKIRKPKDNTQTPPKTLITQRMLIDLGRSVGVTSHPTGVVKPVNGYPTFPLTAKAVLSKGYPFKKN